VRATTQCTARAAALIPHRCAFPQQAQRRRSTPPKHCADPEPGAVDPRPSSTRHASAQVTGRHRRLDVVDFLSCCSTIVVRPCQAAAPATPLPVVALGHFLHWHAAPPRPRQPSAGPSSQPTKPTTACPFSGRRIWAAGRIGPVAYLILFLFPDLIQIGSKHPKFV
jgi:hypothetical protein